MNPRLPGIYDRVAEIGQTGSGKTVFSMWQLSRKDFKELPWIIVDFKREDFAEVKARKIGYEVPKHGGLYIVQPRIDEKKQLIDFLWKVWDEGNVGVYIDEAYMIDFMGANDPYIAILTQGRSKIIPMFNLVQRPVYVSRFIFSEAQFIQLFTLADKRDYETIESFMPDAARLPLPEFHSWYYDHKKKLLTHFMPSPSKEKVISAINAKLHTRKI